MKKTINDQIVATIRNSMPPNENIVSFLADLFLWHKEAIYRRLRSEIAFSYDEIAQIAAKLDFSIDNIVRLNRSERVLFDMSLQQSNNQADLYYEKRAQLVNLAYQISESSGGSSSFAITQIPYSFILYFATLTKFDYYKWLHQTCKINPNTKMSEIVIPENIVQLRESWLTHDRKNSKVTYIMDNNVFLSITREIDYFRNRGLLNEQELEQMKQDLLDLLWQLKTQTESGDAQSGEKILFYLSPIDISTNHFYIEYDDSICCYIQTYGIDILQSYYPEAYQSQREWIELHKRYSTLISQCNEKERFEYFNTQHQYVMSIGNS